MDTGLILQIKKAWPLVKRDLEAARNALKMLAQKYRSTPMVGRTHGQQALPLTFGYKCAVWVDELNRHLERQKRSRAENFIWESYRSCRYHGRFLGEKDKKFKAERLSIWDLQFRIYVGTLLGIEYVNWLIFSHQIAAKPGKIARNLFPSAS